MGNRYSAGEKSTNLTTTCGQNGTWQVERTGHPCGCCRLPPSWDRLDPILASYEIIGVSCTVAVETAAIDHLRSSDLREAAFREVRVAHAHLRQRRLREALDVLAPEEGELDPAETDWSAHSQPGTCAGGALYPSRISCSVSARVSAAAMIPSRSGEYLE